MIQAIGLTSVPRRSRPPTVADLTFEARPGQITVLLGDSGAGKTLALRLLLHLSPGRGVALFRGRSPRHIPHLRREVGVLLGDAPGHPARTARSHLRMLTAVAGVPPDRADELLDATGLGGVADHRLGDYSLGMTRRLGLASALLGDPHTLVLDEPSRGLSPREATWLRGLLCGYAAEGGTVLLTSRDTGEAARLADRVVTIAAGRLVADQEAADFARTRLRTRVTVRSPQAERLATLLVQQSRASAVPGSTGLEVVRESRGRIAVYGSTCATVGETAHQNGILVHHLADDAGDTGDPDGAGDADGARGTGGRRDRGRVTSTGLPLLVPAGLSTGLSAGLSAGLSGHPGAAPPARPGPGPGLARTAAFRPRIPAVPPRGPVRPLRYELRRFAGVRSSWLTMVLALLAGAAAAAVLAGSRDSAPSQVLGGWPAFLPLPPAALAAGLLGAAAYGHEFSHPALFPARETASRRLGLLAAKCTLAALVALLLALLTAGAGLLAVTFLPGAGGSASLGPMSAWPVTAAGLGLLAAGSAWAGVLATVAFRSATAGLVAAVCLPALAVPVLRDTPLGTRLAPDALSGLPSGPVALPWPEGAERWVPELVRLTAQPAGRAAMLLLIVLLGAYIWTSLRRRPR